MGASSQASATQATARLGTLPEFVKFRHCYGAGVRCPPVAAAAALGAGVCSNVRCRLRISVTTHLEAGQVS